MKRIAIIALVVTDREAADAINSLLHEYGEHIMGRMGLPCRERGVNLISVALDAPQDAISAMSGKIGNLPGVSVKTAYSAVVSEE